MFQRFSLVEMLGRTLEQIWVVDVGAMLLDGEPPPYQPLAKAGAARLVGFEAVPAECAKLNAQAGKNQVYLPYFIGDGTERTFHTCNYSMTSSLYEPNTPLLRRFQHLEELTRVVATEKVRTTRLDDVPEIERIDFLKLDVQGAELDVLRGAGRFLASTLLVQVEVEFVEMYKGQPLFADVDQELRRRGFALHTLASTGRTFKPVIHPTTPAAPMRQMLWAEALYVRDFMRLDDLSPARLLQLAVILHEAYESFDLAALCLQHHDAKTKGQLWPYYMKRLLGSVPTPEPLN